MRNHRKLLEHSPQIDFVVPWVDGTDPKWLSAKRHWETIISTDTPLLDEEANADCRYRDNGLLRYWFRSVEKYAPWVNRIFFVTCGQKPVWLEEAHPKLCLISHQEYIPEEFLPTFNSSTIELNLHRINELSEHFVLFNDDMFLLKPVLPEFFFRNGLPVLECDLQIPEWFYFHDFAKVLLNNTHLLNSDKDIGEKIWQHRDKWFNIPALGLRRAIHNFFLYHFNRNLIVGDYQHMALPHLKSTFAEIWRKKEAYLVRVCQNKFRSDNLINQWLACAWNQIEGKFYPANKYTFANARHANSIGQWVWHKLVDAASLKPNIKMNVYTEVNLLNVCDICSAIRKPISYQICLNDKLENDAAKHCNQELAKAFNDILPERSSFEKS